MKKPRITVSHISMFLAILFVISLVSPYLTYSGHGLRNSWAFFSIWLFSTLFWKPGTLQKIIGELKSRKYELSFLYFWLIVVLLNATFDHGYTWDLHLLSMLTMSMVVVIQLCYLGQRDGQYEKLLIIIFILTGLEVLRSLPTLLSQPGLARMVMATTATTEMIAEAGSASVGQYGYYTGLSIVLPVIITRALIATKKLSYALWIVVAVIIFAIAISTFMGAILLMLIGLMFLCGIHLKEAKSRLKVFGIYSVIFIVSASICLTILGNMPQIAYITNKLTKQVTGIASQGIKEGDQTGRSVVWETSLRTVTEYPLLGVGPSTNRENPNLYTFVGGHSSWIDQLAEYGILGFSFYILFLLFAIVGLTKEIRNKSNTIRTKLICYGQLVSCLLFIIGGSYNPVVVITEIFTFFYLMSTGRPHATRP